MCFNYSDIQLREDCSRALSSPVCFIANRSRFPLNQGELPKSTLDESEASDKNAIFFSQFDLSIVLHFLPKLVICAFKLLLFPTPTKNNCDNILLVFFTRCIDKTNYNFLILGSMGL